MVQSVDQQAVDTIRVLAADMTRGANSGHPGAPMGCAPMANVLFSKYLNGKIFFFFFFILYSLNGYINRVDVFTGEELSNASCHCVLYIYKLICLIFIVVNLIILYSEPQKPQVY